MFGEDVTQSLKASDTMMKTFGVSNSEAFNLLAQGAQKGLNKSDELLDTANEYSVYFKTMGFEANEMFDLFSAGMESGAFKLDLVGDAVKEFGISVKDDFKGTGEAFKALGFNADKMSQTFASGGPEAKKAFKQVVDAISKVEDPVKKNTIGVALWKTKWEDLEKDIIAAMGNTRNQFDMTKNTMEEIKSIKYDTIGNAFRGIGRQVHKHFIQPVETFALPYLQRFANWFPSQIPVIKGYVGQVGDSFKQHVLPPLTMIGQRLHGAFEDVKPAITWLGTTGLPVVSDSLVTALNMSKGVYDFFRSNWGAIGPIVAGVTGAFAAYKTAIVVSTVYTKGMAIASTFAAGATTAFGAALAFVTSPLGLIVIGVGAAIAAGVLLYKNWDTIKAKAGEVWQWIKGAFSGAVNGLAGCGPARKPASLDSLI